MNIFQRTKTLFSSSSGAIDIFMKPFIKRDEYVWNKNLAYTYWKKLGILNKAINKRAEKVGEISFYLKKGDEVIREHEILNMLAKPNEMMTGEQFINLWQKYYDIYGEAYILKLPKERTFAGSSKFNLYVLNTAKCNPTFDNLGILSSVEYNGTSYKKEDIIYDYEPDPNEPNTGISLFRSFVNTIGTGIDLEKLLAKTIKGGGKMEGIINFKNPGLTKLQLEEFKKGLLQQMEEAEGYGNFGFIGGDANFQKTSLSINELGYTDLEKRILDKICIATGVPKVLLGSFDDVKYDNADSSIKMFLKETIKPLMRQRCSKLNEQLNIIPTEYELMFDDPSPEDFELKLKTNENGSKNYYMTPNEMRANIGLDEIEGGDDILVPFTMSSQLRETEEIKEEVKKKDFSHPLKNYEFRRKYFEKRIILQDKQESRFKKELDKYLKDQRKRLVNELSDYKSLKKDLLDSSFNITTEIKLGKKLLIPLLMSYMIEAGKDARQLVGGEYVFNWTTRLEESLNNRADFFLKSINETTFSKLKDEFKESLENGENRNELINRIENTYDGFIGSRAKTIARTEVHNAVNEGTLEGYRQADMPIKIWVAVLDDKTRDEHAMMDGEERPIDMPFSNGLMYPNEINCRCQI